MVKELRVHTALEMIKYVDSMSITLSFISMVILLIQLETVVEVTSLQTGQ